MDAALDWAEAKLEVLRGDAVTHNFANAALLEGAKATGLGARVAPQAFRRTDETAWYASRSAGTTRSRRSPLSGPTRRPPETPKKRFLTNAQVRALRRPLRQQAIVFTDDVEDRGVHGAVRRGDARRGLGNPPRRRGTLRGRPLSTRRSCLLREDEDGRPVRRRPPDAGATFKDAGRLAQSQRRPAPAPPPRVSRRRDVRRRAIAKNGGRLFRGRARGGRRAHDRRRRRARGRSSQRRLRLSGRSAARRDSARRPVAFKKARGRDVDAPWRRGRGAGRDATIVRGEKNSRL